MQITIINGGLKGNKSLQDDLNAISLELRDRHFHVKLFNLVEMQINYCCGCFFCWVKSPGKCIYKDDMEKILKEYLRSKIVIFTSEISVGFVSSVLRRATERLLPLFLPYLSIKNGKFCHFPRYNKFPYLVLLLDEKESNPVEEITLINDIHSCMNLNYKFTRLMSEGPKGIADDIEHLCRIT